VYRRVRGEKEISLQELSAIVRKFDISLDRELGYKGSQVGFSCKYLDPATFNFRNYLDEMLSRFRQFVQCRSRNMIYLTKDFPVYHYFHFPEIASFKFFFWMKTYLNFPELQKEKFSFGYLSRELADIGKSIGSLYYQMPSCEIHNPDNILTTLRQIEYFRESLFFENPDDIRIVYESLSNMIDHLEEQARSGMKFLPGQKPNASSPAFQMFVTDFYIGDNTQIVTLDNRTICFKVHNGINYIATEDPVFCGQTLRFMDTVKRNSTCISAVSEKSRERFFYMMRERIALYRDKNHHPLHPFPHG
jgi:hypothetical protein